MNRRSFLKRGISAPIAVPLAFLFPASLDSLRARLAGNHAPTPLSSASRMSRDITVTIEGNQLASEEYVRRVVIPEIQKAINTKDVVLISPYSRQAAQLK